MSAPLPDYAHAPWGLHLDATPVLVRPASPRDLPAIARMHRRCTARTLLDRYRQGGLPPTAAALDADVRNPYCIVALVPGGDAIALASLRRDANHGESCAEVAVLVENKWQQKGLGGELTAHLAGLAHLAGFTELIAYPGATLGGAQRIMTGIGRSRMVPGGTSDAHAHMHTYISEASALGIGAVRMRLAG